MPHSHSRSDLDTEQTRVRLSLAQLWSIIGAVAVGTFMVAGALNAIRSEQSALRSDFAYYRLQAEQQFSATTGALAELKADRAEAVKEWTAWRHQKDAKDIEQDSALRLLQLPRRPGSE